jgi:CubicO group peptidase (beta-lactamase class C family)
MANLASIAEVLKRAADAGDVPGVAAAVATIDGPVFEAAFGKRDLTTGAPIAPDTVVRIASMTKAITGACAMQLVEQGKLDLDGPIGRVLPELGAIKVFDGFGADGRPKLRPPKRPVTLRHLLTHTSGHVYDTWNGDSGVYREKAGLPPLDTGLNASLSTPLFFDPGERWEYGIGIDWAGKAVEAASGLKLADYMKRNLYDPLGMPDTSFRTNDEQTKRLAQIYLRTPEGLKPFERNPPKNPEFDAGGGGLYSTVRDYLKFAQMILHKGTFNGAQVLKPATVELMSQNAMGATDVTMLKTFMPVRSNDVHFTAGMKWGLTFMINPKPKPAGRSAGSLAWAGLMNSYFWIDPVKKVTGVYATQILPFCDVKSLPLFEAFETAVYQAL